MKKVTFLFPFMFLISVAVSGQVHQISFSHTPPPIPIVNAGPDTLISWGSSFLLQGSVTGGTSPFTCLWQPTDNIDDSTLLSPTFTYPSTGGAPVVMTLTVTDKNGCESSDQVTISGYVNSVDEAGEFRLRIYPNPSTGVILIEGLPAGETSTEVSFYSVTGKLLFVKTFTHTSGKIEADLRPVTTGFYLISVQHGEYRYMQNIIIQ